MQAIAVAKHAVLSPKENDPKTISSTKYYHSSNNLVNRLLREGDEILTNDQIENASITFRTTRPQDDICAICQDHFAHNQNVRRLIHCNHYFHQDCIDIWFRGNVHCPTCRHDIRETEQGNVNERNNNPPPVPENHRRMNIRRQDNI